MWREYSYVKREICLQPANSRDRHPRWLPDARQMLARWGYQMIACKSRLQNPLDSISRLSKSLQLEGDTDLRDSPIRTSSLRWLRQSAYLSSNRKRSLQTTATRERTISSVGVGCTSPHPFTHHTHTPSYTHIHNLPPTHTPWPWFDGHRYDDDIQPPKVADQVV